MLASFALVCAFDGREGMRLAQLQEVGVVSLNQQ